jgi:hypothetical protein
LRRLCLGAVKGSGKRYANVLKGMLSKHSQGNWQCKDVLTSLTLHGFPLEGLYGMLASVVSFLNLTELVLWNCENVGDFLNELVASIRDDDLRLKHLAIMASKRFAGCFNTHLNPLFYFCKHLQSLSLEWSVGADAPLALEETIAKLKDTLRILSLHDRCTMEGDPPSLPIATLKRICGWCPHLQQLGYITHEEKLFATDDASMLALWVSLSIPEMIQRVPMSLISYGNQPGDIHIYSPRVHYTRLFMLTHP